MIAFLKGYAVQILGGALGLSLLGNVFFGVLVNHYADKAATCKANVVAVNKIATAEKKIVEARQEKSVNETQASVTDRIYHATARVRLNQSRKPDLSYAAKSPSGVDAKDRTTELLPGRVSDAPSSEEQDQLICTTNTVLAEEWQTFYMRLIEIREDQSVGNTNP